MLVENVIRDCVPFILLTLAVLIGFGLAMFAVLQSIMHKMDFEEDSETKVAIDQGFGNPVKSILTLFYAMVGMFDPTVSTNQLSKNFNSFFNRSSSWIVACGAF